MWLFQGCVCVEMFKEAAAWLDPQAKLLFWKLPQPPLVLLCWLYPRGTLCVACCDTQAAEGWFWAELCMALLSVRNSWTPSERGHQNRAAHRSLDAGTRGWGGGAYRLGPSVSLCLFTRKVLQLHAGTEGDTVRCTDLQPELSQGACSAPGWS